LWPLDGKPARSETNAGGRGARCSGREGRAPPNSPAATRSTLRPSEIRGTYRESHRGRSAGSCSRDRLTCRHSKYETLCHPSRELGTLPSRRRRLPASVLFLASEHLVWRIASLEIARVTQWLPSPIQHIAQRSVVVRLTRVAQFDFRDGCGQASSPRRHVDREDRGGPLLRGRREAAATRW